MQTYRTDTAEMTAALYDIDRKLYTGNITGLRRATLRLLDGSEQWLEERGDEERLDECRKMKRAMKYANADKLSFFCMKLLEYAAEQMKR